MLETLSILVHAESKTGKTTLASSAPVPILILDAEGGTKFLPIRKVEWDPVTGPPPVWDGTWDACIVTVRDWNAVQLTWQWLIMGQHNFQSVVVDSITEIQRRCKQNLKGTDAMKIQDWGSLLTAMDNVIRGYRDLTLHPTKPIRVAIFIAETREVNGKWKPYMQGQIAVALPYWMDIVGYLYVEAIPTIDENGQATQHSTKIRRLLISQHPQFEAGERVQGRLGEVVDSPNITTMLTTVYPELLQQQGA